MFVLDCETEIFVWCGKESSFEEKKAAFVLAEELIGTFDHEKVIPITRIAEGSEICLFKEQFVGLTCMSFIKQETDWTDEVVMPTEYQQKGRVAGNQDN